MMRSTLPWSRTGHVVVAALCCICVLLPLVQGLDGQEIDLEFANHDVRDTASAVDKVVSDSKHADVATLRNPSASWVRKDKPNKSSSKKFTEKGWLDSEYGKSKKSIYDKKYFDYLPAELKDSPETSADVRFSKRTNSRRIRRSAEDATIDNAEESRRSKRHGWYVQPVASYSYTVPQMVYSVGNWPAVVSQQYPAVYQQPSLPFGPTYGSRGPFTTPANVDRTYLPPTTTRRPNSTPPNRTYLPVPTPSPNDDGPIDGGLGNRFNINDDRFVFDVVYDTNRINYNLMPRPQQGRIPQASTTRRPQASFRPETATVSPGRTTTTPRPSIQHNSDDDYDWSSLGLDSDIGNRLGIDGENSNNDVSGTNQGRKKPSKCTWAIANCCSHNSDRIRYYCFEQNQCYGAFWGENVCRRYFQAALKEIENYYDV